MSWQITQMTPHIDEVHPNDFKTSSEAIAYAELHMIDSFDQMNSSDRSWEQKTNGSIIRNVHEDYQILIKEI